MENIYDDVSKKEPIEEEELYVKIVGLKDFGHSWREISEKLNKPKSSLHDVYKKYGCPRVSEKQPRTSEKVSESVRSVADQPLTIEYIKQHYVNNIELQKLKEHIEEVVNSRLNMGLKQLKDYINEKLKEVKTSP